jgi:hypothetical protein
MVEPAPTNVGSSLKAVEIEKANGYGILSLIKAVVNSSILVVERNVTPVIRNIAVLIPIANPYRIDSNVKSIIQNENNSVGPFVKNGQRSVEKAIRIKNIYLRFQRLFKLFPIQATIRVKIRIGKRYKG